MFSQEYRNTNVTQYHSLNIYNPLNFSSMLYEEMIAHSLFNYQTYTRPHKTYIDSKYGVGSNWLSSRVLATTKIKRF